MADLKEDAIPSPLAIRALPEATDASIGTSLDQQAAALRERLQTTLLLQDQASAESLTNQPSPWIQGISSAIISALPYLAGRASGGAEGGLLGAQLGMKGNEQYQAQIQQDQKRKADIADLYLKRSTALDSQLTQLTTAKESLAQKAEAEKMRSEDRDLTRQMMERGDKQMAQLRADANRDNRLNDIKQQALEERRVKVAEDRLALARAQGAKKTDLAPLEAEAKAALLEPGPNLYVPAGDLGKAENVKTVKAAAELKKQATGKQYLLRLADDLVTKLEAAGGNINDAEVNKTLAALRGELKSDRNLNLGAALNASENSMLYGVIGLVSRADFKDRMLSAAFGDNPRAMARSLRRDMAQVTIEQALDAGVVPAYGRDLIAIATEGLTPEQATKFSNRLKERVKPIVDYYVYRGEARDEADAFAKVNSLMRGQETKSSYQSKLAQARSGN